MAIPKIIHYCWFGYGKKSELVERCIESWKKYAPECEIIEWNESNYDVSKNRYMRQAFEEKRWSFISDYARLDIVYEHGGIYLDTDVELIRPIADLLESDGFCGFERAYKNGLYSVNTGNGFGANKNDPVIKTMRDYYDGFTFINDDGTQNLRPSPFYNTKALVSVGLDCDNSIQTIGNIKVYPYEYFCPVDWETHKCETTLNTYSIHHFDASWLSEEEKKHRKLTRKMDNIVHLPNRALKTLLGEKRYEKLKKMLKG